MPTKGFTGHHPTERTYLWVWPKRISLELEEELTEVIARLMTEKANYPCTSRAEIRTGLPKQSSHLRALEG